MKTSKILGIASLTLLLGGLIFLSGVQADAWNKKTVLTINQPLRIPGAILPPGEYVLKLLDSASNRHIVQVFSEDESKVYATILAIPNYRMQPTGETAFTFWEMPKGSPLALRSWFYPGDNFGQEFAYPKAEATQIAAQVNEEVPTMTDEQQAELSRTPADVEESAAAQREAPVSVLDQEGVGSAESNTPAQQPGAQTPPQATQPQTEEDSELPRTASPYTLLAVIGLLALGASSGFRLLRRHIS